LSAVSEQAHYRRRKGRGGTRPYQNRKREIIQATIGGEEEFAAALNWDKIQELLA